MPKKKACSDFGSEEESSPKKMKHDMDNPQNTSESEKSPGKQKKKKKTVSSDSEEENDPERLPNMLHNLEEQLERELETKAKRNNLTAWNVKNMIKAVISDTEVIKMVDYSLQKTVEKPVYEVKLTRAKTKQLLGLKQNAIFNIPTLQKNADIEALITQELPEDSSDEEYEPYFEGSDDESKVSEVTMEDDNSELDTSIRSSASVDIGIKNENIGQRTRSKLSLSETPLEAIEQSFIPPDITTDMYNTDCENEDWLNFLKEFMQPLDSTQAENNDDENDPEYNVMMDEEREAADKEELREDRAVKVTKKELNDLMAELFEYTQMLSSDDEDTKTNKIDYQKYEKNDIEIPTIEGSPQTVVECDVINQFSDAQYLLLNQQMQQHVQLLLQSYLLSYGHPRLDEDYPNKFKQYLLEISSLRNGRSSSYFNVINLDSSINLMNEWTEAISTYEQRNRVQRFILKELEKVEKYRKTKVVYLPELPLELIEMCLRSDAFLFPLFLPQGGFKKFDTDYATFTPSEDMLIAIGLEEFSSFFKMDLESRSELTEIVSYINHYLIPTKRFEKIMQRIKNLVVSPKVNPIKEFFETRKAPEVNQYVTVHTRLHVLSTFPIDYFPSKWHKYLIPE